MSITRYIKSDIRDTELLYIGQGVNCQNTMGSGVARALFEKWPEVKEQYHEYCGMYFDQFPSQMLGIVDEVPLEGGKTVLNMFTQVRYGYDDKRYVNYGAIAKCFLAVDYKEHVKRLAIPKIGCGLAGGNWVIVKEIINDCTPNTEIWVYEL